MTSSFWVVFLYYGLFLITTVFFRYVLLIKWFSSIVISLVITLIILLITAPDLVVTGHETPGELFLAFLMLLLTVLSPIIIIIYVFVAAFTDHINQVCKVQQDTKPFTRIIVDQQHPQFQRSLSF